MVLTDTNSNSTQREISLRQRVSDDLWRKIERAAILGESILEAQEHRYIGRVLNQEQIQTLASASGVIETYSPALASPPSLFFTQGKLPEETLHNLATKWRNSSVNFVRCAPDNVIYSHSILQCGLAPLPERYKREA